MNCTTAGPRAVKFILDPGPGLLLNRSGESEKQDE